LHYRVDAVRQGPAGLSRFRATLTLAPDGVTVRKSRRTAWHYPWTVVRAHLTADDRRATNWVAMVAELLTPRWGLYGGLGNDDAFFQSPLDPNSSRRVEVVQLVVPDGRFNLAVLHHSAAAAHAALSRYIAA
jgi:hypothetical protein